MYEGQLPEGVTVETRQEVDGEHIHIRINFPGKYTGTREELAGQVKAAVANSIKRRDV